MTAKNNNKQPVSSAPRAWSTLCFGSLILFGAASSFAQELTPPRYLTDNGAAGVSKSVLELRLPSSVHEQPESGLPSFPETSEASAQNTSYIPSALLGGCPVFLATSLQDVNLPSQGDGIVVPLESKAESYTSVIANQDAAAPNRVSSELWTLKPVDQLELAMHNDRLRPENAAAGMVQASAAAAGPYPKSIGTVAAWVAPNITYQPLLFEDARLERYGYASPYFGVQPVRSGLHFATSSILFPWRAWFHRNECESPLAFERPGSCAPSMREVFVPAVANGWSRP